MTDIVKVEHGIDAIERMGHFIAASGLFGVKNNVQAVALMLIAQSEGRHPASAAQDYHIIQGRPSLKADMMLARFQAAGGKVEWTAYTDSQVVGKFSHPQGGTVSVDWDMARAKQAGLGTKDNWKNYPRAMLRARVISEGVRTVYPAVLGGMYTPEEVMDFEPLPELPTTSTMPMLPANTSVEAPGPLVPGTVETHFLEPLPAPPTTDHSQRVDIGNMLLEMCGSKDEAAAMLQILTSFKNKEGKQIKGRDSVKALSEKQVPVVYRKVRDQFEKWQAVQEQPPTEDDIPFETEDDLRVE